MKETGQMHCECCGGADSPTAHPRTQIIADYLRQLADVIADTLEAFQADGGNPQYAAEIMQALAEADKKLIWVFQQAIAVRQT